MSKPFVRWVGGKTRLIPELWKHLPKEYDGLIPDDVTYYEPFAGGGAMLFTLQPKHAVISDVNTDLICAYLAVKNFPEELIARLYQHAGHATDREYYYRVRALDRDMEWAHPWTEHANIIERAARLLFLNRTCFNGMYRVNKKGFFNVPYGYNCVKDGAVVQTEIIRAAHAYLSGNYVAIGQASYADVLRDCDSDSFVFLDPPYDDTFNGYSPDKFDDKMQERLFLEVLNLDVWGVKFMLTNKDTPFIRDLYSGFFNIHEVEAPQQLSGKASARVPRKELIITNYD